MKALSLQGRSAVKHRVKNKVGFLRIPYRNNSVTPEEDREFKEEIEEYHKN